MRSDEYVTVLSGMVWNWNGMETETIVQPNKVTEGGGVSWYSARRV